MQCIISLISLALLFTRGISAAPHLADRDIVTTVEAPVSATVIFGTAATTIASAPTSVVALVDRDIVTTVEAPVSATVIFGTAATTIASAPTSVVALVDRDIITTVEAPVATTVIFETIATTIAGVPTSVATPVTTVVAISESPTTIVEPTAVAV
ncbi:hypothetical protein OF83DRAFT_1084236 [Amylostereum chailletii]|nr:hypothetical protein OF83DRAFT_1084236 [Amylostereum chailletii]